MKEIRLRDFTVDNFQGIKHFDYDFESKNATIFGDNATGKTSLKNAFMWLLFNKNSHGLTKFGFRPKDENGDLEHGLTTSVEATFLAGDTPITLKRAVSEKVSTVRGTNTRTYKDVSEWYVNNVPKKKSEYEKEVSSLIDENIFKMITDPLYFNTQIKWEERRNILMDICGDIPDDEILDSSEELKELKGMLNGQSVNDFKEITVHAMKPIAESLKKIPVQIDEAERAKPDTSELEYDEGQLNYLKSLIEEKENELADIKYGKALILAKNKLSELQDKLNSLPMFFKDETEEYKRIKELERDLAHQLSNKDMTESAISKFKSDIEINKVDFDKLSKEWDKVFAAEFVGNICPTCKQELPPDEVEAHRKEFNIQKSNDLDAIEQKMNIIKYKNSEMNDKIQGYEHDISIFEAEINNHKSDIESLTVELENKQKAYNEKREKEIQSLNIEIEEAKDEVMKIELSSSEIVEKLQEEIQGFKEEKSSIDTKIMNKALLEKQDKRIEELKAQEKLQAIEYESMQRKLYLCEEFIRTKAEMLTERINSNFSLAKFKLFEIQKNEGIKETCEVTYEGIPYTDLNNAGRINIGLDIINTLCKKYDVTAPIICDNMEAVNEPFDTFSQMIQLRVSKDGSLKVERE